MCLTSKATLDVLRGHMVRHSMLLAVVAASSMLFAGLASAQALDADQWSHLAMANDLESEGKTPFHLKMTFQLYDLEGKESEVGMVEEWWSAPFHKHTAISSQSLNVGGATPNHSDSSATRESYLVHELLNLALTPVMTRIARDGIAIEGQKRDFGKTVLECFGPKLGGSVGIVLGTICTDPNTDHVRAIVGDGGDELKARNSVGNFHDTHVALDLLISYMGHYAIAGKVTTLESIDPAKITADDSAAPTAAFGSPSATQTAAATGTAARVPAGVIAGNRISFVQPEYPRVAQVSRMSGKVLVHALIGKDGSVQNLAPIATSNLIFTDAAMNAVRKWKYSPFLLNGEPTEVDTTITVNFALSR